MLYLITTLFLAIGAINSQNNLLFWAFGLAIAGVLISGVISGTGLMGLRIERLPIREARLGEPSVVRYRLRNRNRLMPAYALTIEEVDRETRKGPRESWPAFFSAPSAFVPQARARRDVTSEALMMPRARGVATLRVIRISSTFPFGLMRKSMVYEQIASATVLPARVTLCGALRRDVRACAESGTQVSTRVGMGDDFFGIREYVPGDPPRQIAWRASARVGELLVRQTSAPAPHRLWVVLDLRSESRTDWSFELAIAAGAELLRDATAQGLAVGLCVPGFGIIEAPRQGPRHVALLERRLAQLDPGAPGSGHDEIPARSFMRESFFVIHAGEVDHTVGPHTATRVSALEPSHLVIDPDTLPESLRPDSAPTGGSP